MQLQIIRNSKLTVYGSARPARLRRWAQQRYVLHSSLPAECL
jgi:hypothetical protein